MFDGVKAYFERAKRFGETYSPETGQGALDTVLSLVIAGVGLMIGVYVFDEIIEGMDIDVSAAPENRTAVENIVNDIWGAYSMAPIVLLVLVAGAIIGVLSMFRRE